MTTTLLASFPSPAQGVWYLGPVPIRAYALCIIAGIIAALVIGDRRWVARGGERGVIYDIALWAVPFGLIGGRIYHLMTDWSTYFGEGGAGPAAALRIGEGGLGIWGAVAFGGVGAWIACRRRGIPLPAFGDAVAPGIVLAQAIGRLGNYFNQELYGRETTVPWGMEIFYRRDSSGMVDVHSLDGVSTGQVAAVVHPTFLYELLWNLAVFALLIWVDRRYRMGHGRLFALYVAAYCVGRFWVELLRDDTATEIAGIRINVFTATFVFIGAVVYMLLAPKGRDDPATLRGTDSRGPEDESPVDEFVEELVAAAKGSGIVAAATVAGEHEPEDAHAVGDDQPDFADTVAAEEMATEAQLETELAEAVADSGPVVVYEESPEDATETVVRYESAADEAGETDAEPDAAAEADAGADIESEAEPEAESEPEAEAFEPDVEPEAEIPEAQTPEAAAEPEAEPDAEAVEPEAEPEAEPEPEAVGADVETDVEPEVEVLSEPAPDAAAADGEPEQKAPGFGSTLRRLLWGVRSGD